MKDETKENLCEKSLLHEISNVEWSYRFAIFVLYISLKTKFCKSIQFYHGIKLKFVQFFNFEYKKGHKDCVVISAVHCWHVKVAESAGWHKTYRWIKKVSNVLTCQNMGKNEFVLKLISGPFFLNQWKVLKAFFFKSMENQTEFNATLPSQLNFPLFLFWNLPLLL